MARVFHGTFPKILSGSSKRPPDMLLSWVGKHLSQSASLCRIESPLFSPVQPRPSRGHISLRIWLLLTQMIRAGQGRLYLFAGALKFTDRLCPCARIYI